MKIILFGLLFFGGCSLLSANDEKNDEVTDNIRFLGNFFNLVAGTAEVGEEAFSTYPMDEGVPKVAFTMTSLEDYEILIVVDRDGGTWFFSDRDGDGLPEEGFLVKDSKKKKFKIKSEIVFESGKKDEDGKNGSDAKSKD